MKKVLLTLLTFTFLSQSLMAQTGHGKISGIILDAENNQPVEFSNIALIDPKTNKPIDGAVADDKGKFTIHKIANGTYHVTISFIGYETKTIENISLTDTHNNITLGTIKLPSSAKVLSEVVVEGQKSLIEEKVDRTVYNAENDKTAAGGDAADVLKRVPMLSVDMDGNVSMRGNSNITVLINNKPSTIMASSVADALKQIPADEIKSVEVITSPSAKYDAEGSAGIINIITKKNTLQGLTLNVTSSAGLRGSNLGLNGNYRKNKLGISLGGHGRAGYNTLGSFENRQLYKQTGKLNTQEADTRNNNLSGNYNLGIDYEINKYNSVAASARFGLRNGSSYQDDLTTRIVGDTTTLSNISTIDNSLNYNLNFTYTRTFEKPQREFSILTMYSRNNRNNDFNANYFDLNDNSILQRNKNLNTSYNEEFTFQADYQSPIKNNQLIEFGGKEIIRTVSSDYQYLRGTGASGSFTSSRPNNLFSYNQNVTSGYVSYTLTTKKSYSFKVGSRYEHTVIEANFQNAAESNKKIPSYGVLVPSLNISKKLKNGNSLKASYNRRIQRPSIQFLNPYLQINSPLSQSQGNPELSPEYTNNFELTYSTFIKGTSLNFSAFTRNTNNGIQTVRNILNDSILFTTYKNIGSENAYGLNLFVGINAGKLTLNGGGDLYYAVLTNNVTNPEYAAANKGWVVSGRFFGGYNLNKGWGLQFFTFYRARQVQLQGTQGGMGVYSLSIKKDFANKKASIGIGAENFFLFNGMKIRNNVNSYSVDQSSTNIMYNMNFKINFSFTIGKMGFDQMPKRRKSVNNDDLKDGGGDGGGMDMGGQQMQQRGNGNMPQVMRGMQQAKPVKPDTTKQKAATVDATGVWMYAIETQMGTTNGKFTIKKVGDVYSGTMFSSQNNQEVQLHTVTVNGNELTAIYTSNFGGNEIEITIKGLITGDDFAGTMSFGTFRTMPLKATRTK